MIKLRVFDEFFQLATQQALLQFANFLPLMAVSDSSQAAKENAVFSLIYINLVRMVFEQMITDTDKPLLSLEFFNKMARIDTDEDMDKFVIRNFIPIVNSPKTVGVKMPKFNALFDATSALLKHLYKNYTVSNFFTDHSKRIDSHVHDEHIALTIITVIFRAKKIIKP